MFSLPVRSKGKPSSLVYLLLAIWAGSMMVEHGENAPFARLNSFPRWLGSLDKSRQLFATNVILHVLCCSFQFNNLKSNITIFEIKFSLQQLQLLKQVVLMTQIRRSKLSLKQMKNNQQIKRAHNLLSQFLQIGIQPQERI